MHALRSMTDIKTLRKKARSNKRSATVLYFSYGALNNLVISLRLLVSGYLASSGNLMRGFAEATAMMLLCSHPSINTLNQFWKNPNQFSMHNALDLAFVRKKCDKEAGRAGFKHGFLRPRIPEIDKELPNACGKGIETSIQRESTNSIVSAWGSGPMTPGEQKSNKRRSTTGRRWLRGPSRILSLISFFLLVDEYCKKIVPPG